MRWRSCLLPLQCLELGVSLEGDAGLGPRTVVVAHQETVRQRPQEVLEQRRRHKHGDLGPVDLLPLVKTITKLLHHPDIGASPEDAHSVGPLTPQLAEDRDHAAREHLVPGASVQILDGSPEQEPDLLVSLRNPVRGVTALAALAHTSEHVLQLHAALDLLQLLLLRSNLIEAWDLADFSKDERATTSLPVLVIGLLILVVEGLPHPVQLDDQGHLVTDQGVGGLLQLGLHPQLELSGVGVGVVWDLEAVQGLLDAVPRAVPDADVDWFELKLREISLWWFLNDLPVFLSFLLIASIRIFVMVWGEVMHGTRKNVSRDKNMTLWWTS